MTNSPLVAHRLLKFARTLIRRTHGQDLVEYAILAGIVTSLTIAILGDIGQRVTGFYASTVTQMAARTSDAGTMPIGAGGGNGNGNGNGGGKK